ncbi:MAG TPA: hypothetical protein VLI90_01990 [Tepidisphaeraceae bacterium]|nr:hypothetical protein [Tepidisphaeraceae bacterium]
MSSNVEAAALSRVVGQSRRSIRTTAKAAAAGAGPLLALVMMGGGVMPASVARAGTPQIVVYTGPNGGNWSLNSNWTPANTPSAGDTIFVTLAPTSAFSVNFDSSYSDISGSRPAQLTINSSTTFPVTLNQVTALRNLFVGIETIGTTGQATYNQTGSTHGPGTLFLGGNVGGSGTYLLSSAGVLSANSEVVGSAGAGTFSQSGGSNSTSGDLSIAQFANSAGTYSLTGTSSLSVGGSLYIGGSSGGAGGSGSFTIAGGTVSVPANIMRVYNTTGTQLNLSSGVLRTKALDLSGQPSLLNWTGGTLAFPAGYTVNSAFALGSTISMPGSGVLSNDAAAATNSGTINMNGGTLSGTGLLTNAGTINGPGTVAVPISNTGTISNAVGTLVVNANVTSSGSATFAAGQQWATGTTFTNTAGIAGFQSDPGGATGAYNLNVNDTGGLVFFLGGTDHLAGLSIASGVTAEIHAAAAPFHFPTIVDVTNLSFPGTGSGPGSGKLDVQVGELIVQSSVATVQGMLANNNVTSTNLASNTALGYKDLNNGKTEVRFTVKGDANLDGLVNVGDLGALATNYGLSAGAVWSQGNFNNDAIVNVGDLGILATNYGMSLAGGPSAGGAVAADAAVAVAAVPEPSMIAPMALLLSSIGARRFTRRKTLGPSGRR